MAEALYRKYRPQIFEDVVGQEHIERTLKNALDQDKVSHAYLFSGPRGTGKTTTARLLAKALLCESGPTSSPDGTCEDCQLIARGEHPDVYELDAASRTGVENVREEIIGRVNFAPTRGRYKVYIVDEVHMLSVAAFNALLKTIEEPPAHVVFILCTTDPQKVPETIHSRCQRFEFRRISTEEIVSRLGAVCVAEGVEFEAEALDLIAHRAEGGMRNALTTLEQLIAFGEGKVTMEVAERMLGSLDSNELAEIVRAIGNRDVAACFRWTAEYSESGADLAQFTMDLAEHFRNMYIMSLAGVGVALEVSETTKRELADELVLFGQDRLARLLSVLGDLASELRTSTNARLSFEIALTRMVRPESDLTLSALAERVEALERAMAAGARPEAVGNRSVAMGARSATAGGSTAAPRVEPTENAPVATEGKAFLPTVSDTRQVDSRQTDAQASRTAQAQVPASLQGNTNPASLKDLANPAVLQRVWGAALSELKKTKIAYGVFLMDASVSLADDGSSLLIEFPPDKEAAFNTLHKPEAQNILKGSLASAYGASVPFTMKLGSKKAAQKAAEPAPSPQRAASQPIPQPASAPRHAAPQVAAQPAPEQRAATAAYSQATSMPLSAPAPQSTPTPSSEPTLPVTSTPSPEFAPPQQVESPAPRKNDDEAADLNAILSFGFGDTATFELIEED